jgi:hypothetical protein
MMRAMTRNSALRIVLTLVAVNAAFGVFALLGGEIGDTEAKVFATSLLATMGATLALICAPAAAAGRVPPWPQVGIATGLAAAGTFMIALWADAPEGLLDVGGAAVSFSLASALVSVLSSWPASGSMAWVRLAASGLALVGAAMVSVSLFAVIDLDGYWRLFGIVMVLLGATAIATPIVSRMSPPAEAGGATFGHCPFCGAAIDGVVGTATQCPSCRRSYLLRIA